MKNWKACYTSLEFSKIAETKFLGKREWQFTLINSSHCIGSVLLYFKGSVVVADLPAISSAVCSFMSANRLLLSKQSLANHSLNMSSKKPNFLLRQREAEQLLLPLECTVWLFYLPEAFMINVDTNIPSMNARFDEASAEKPTLPWVPAKIHPRHRGMPSLCPNVYTAYSIPCIPLWLLTSGPSFQKLLCLQHLPLSRAVFTFLGTSAGLKGNVALWDQILRISFFVSCSECGFEVRWG